MTCLYLCLKIRINGIYIPTFLCHNILSIEVPFERNEYMNIETKTNKKYKDSIFRRLFGENRENALSLYNALNGTSYTTAGDLDAAIDQAVKECIEENVLKEFLEKQRREAINVCLTEFDEEKFENMLKEEGRAEGELEMLLKLVKTKVLALEVALSMTSLSREEFLAALEK